MNLQLVKQAASSAGLVERGHEATFLGHCVRCSTDVRDNGIAVADLDGPAFAAYFCVHCAAQEANGSSQ